MAVRRVLCFVFAASVIAVAPPVVADDIFGGLVVGIDDDRLAEAELVE